jgi:hypothetical protein
VALVSRLAALSALAFLALAAPAAAGPPGSWTKVTNFNSQGSNTDQVSLARTGNGVLHVLWAQDSNNAVLNTRLSADAQNVLGASTVFTYGDTVNNRPALLAVPGGLRAFFAGLFSGDQNHDGGLSTATSADGASWAVQPTLASATDGAGNEASTVYVASGIDATLFSNGTPLSIWGDPGSGYHVGTSQGTPDVRYGTSGASTFDPGAATDSATGAVAIGWNDLDAGSVRVAFVQPTTSPWFPRGPIMVPPGSGAPDLQIPVAMTGRSGGAGGIYVAYLRGTNPFGSSPAIWRVGAPNAFNLTNTDGRLAGVTMGPAGRLWAFWREEPGTTIHARRSNASAGTWGADTVVDPPGGTSTVWGLAGEGSAVACGALDLVAHASVGSDLANYHQRVLAGLDLKKKILNGKKGEKEKVRFKTLDAGDPVDATVKFGNKKAETGNDGKVKMKIKRKAKNRKVKATAKADCFESDQLKVKVTKLRN